MKSIRINFDGACNNHLEEPPAGVGVAVFIDGVYSDNLSYAVPIYPNELGLRNTNNTTEWQGCLYAMQTFRELRLRYPSANFTVQSDSQIVVQVFNGRHQTHTEHFKLYNEQAKNILGKTNLLIEWVKRDFNKEADKLSKLAIKQATI